MLFFKSLILSIFIFLSAGQAIATTVDLKDIIKTTELGSCQTNDLAYTSMKFYKIPLNQKYEDYDLYLRIILFFGPENTLSLRSTIQALLGCQTSSSGEEICSFRPLNDQWVKLPFDVSDKIFIPQVGTIDFRDQSNINRGFVLTFSNDFSYTQLRAKEFSGGMIKVNFNQDGINTAKICKK